MLDHGAWIEEQISGLVDNLPDLSVSEWAEECRYLPASTTSIPGYYSYEVAPYLKEIADCLSITSPIEIVDFMKGAQIGATVGILENALGYYMDHVSNAPMMLITADDGLARTRMEQYIEPMIEHSNLSHLIAPLDDGSKRRTGKTLKRITFSGGGFLMPLGAQSANKLRSVSIRVLLEDEVDGWPVNAKNQGGPQKLIEARTKSYYIGRKIARISTPLIEGSSLIDKGFRQGDQRYFNVPCKKCHAKQVLKFRGEFEGRKYGLTWKLNDNGELDRSSVRYVCKHCGHEHRNSDKLYMLENGEWVPTSTSSNPRHRSYHLSALYSPVSMYPWEAIAADWLACWDDETNNVKDADALQEFYNNILGQVYRVTGSRVSRSQVSSHRRPQYRKGEVCNHFAVEFCSSRIQFLTCTVDVHKYSLNVAVIGWTEGSRCILIDYEVYRIKDKNSSIDCSDTTAEPWERLRSLIEEQVFVADDGTSYKVLTTLIDCGWSYNTVVEFCSEYESGVYPLKGDPRVSGKQVVKEFAEFTTTLGTLGYRVQVDHYKDRLGPVLRREWHEANGLQKEYHFNAPFDIGNKALEELTKETRVEKETPSGKVYVWHRPNGAANELWDLLVYGNASVEIIAYGICLKHFELNTINWQDFWQFCEENPEVFARHVDNKSVSERED